MDGDKVGPRWFAGDSRDCGAEGATGGEECPDCGGLGFVPGERFGWSSDHPAAERGRALLDRRLAEHGGGSVLWGAT